MLQMAGSSSRFKGLWSFDLTQHTWTCLGGEPSSVSSGSWPDERSLHVAGIVATATTHVLVVYGGVGKVGATHRGMERS